MFAIVKQLFDMVQVLIVAGADGNVSDKVSSA